MLCSGRFILVKSVSSVQSLITKLLLLSGNYLIHMDASVITNLDMLETLDLSSNYFMGMDQVFFDVLNRKQRPRLKMVYLQVSFFFPNRNYHEE